MYTGYVNMFKNNKDGFPSHQRVFISNNTDLITGDFDYCWWFEKGWNRVSKSYSK